MAEEVSRPAGADANQRESREWLSLRSTVQSSGETEHAGVIFGAG